MCMGKFVYDVLIFQFWLKLRIPLQFPTYMCGIASNLGGLRLVTLDEAWQGGVHELTFVFLLQIRRKKYCTEHV